ncbi:MAG: T9SS type A sorting domain-containing protein [Muribaculaceae bacterium]|nr:T9SS type A sorting domain-containing protein [Muribaculaceae bacterium]
MKRLLVILSVILSLMMAAPEADAQMVWRESSRSITKQSLIDPGQNEGIEIFVFDGVVCVRTPHRIQVRVFTILGQLVSQSYLNPGQSELKIASRGIYIIKIGNITQKVAI